MNHLNPSIKKWFKPNELPLKPVEYFAKGIQSGDLYILSEAITLLESENALHREIADEILRTCFSRDVRSKRIGITGSPGVGKSTFIDSVAMTFVSEGDKVAVLTIDPSSNKSHGSILGDKTRMEEIISHRDIYIRPSPSKTFLGGLNQYTYEAILLCEAAGFNTIFIETVGTGQSEIDIAQIADLTILLVLPGSGDSLQGIKKGIVEQADIVIINKSDGNQLKNAQQSKKDFKQAFHFTTQQSQKEVLNYSSIEKTGLDQVFETINKLLVDKQKANQLERLAFEKSWLKTRLEDHVNQILSKEMEDQKIAAEIEELLNTSSPFDILSQLKTRIRIEIDEK